VNNLDNNTINDLLIKSIETAAAETLPETVAQKLYQPWQNDEKLRDLYVKKDELFKKNADQKTIQQLRKKIRKRSRQLRNEYFKEEARKLNVLSATRELEKLFTLAKVKKQVMTSIQNCLKNVKIRFYLTPFIT